MNLFGDWAGELLVTIGSAAARDVFAASGGEQSRRIKRLGKNVKYDTSGGRVTGYRRVGRARDGGTIQGEG